MRTTRVGAVFAALFVTFAASAAAQEPILQDDPGQWPTEVTRRPLTLGAGMVELSVPVNFNLSKGAEGEPVFLNPSLSFGMSDRWTLGVRHFLGLCLNGASHGCPNTYNDVSVTSRFSLGRASGLDLALGLALNAAPLPNDTSFSGEAGLMIRAGGGALALTLAPTVNFGLNKRDTYGKRFGVATNLATYDLITPEDVLPNRDWLLVPATLQLQLGPTLALAVSAAVNGPLNPEVGSYGDYYRVPVGVAAVLSPLRYVDLGAGITFPHLAGKSNTADDRFVSVFLAFRT